MPKMEHLAEGMARTYAWFGVDFVSDNRADQAIAVCPFCGKEGKFYVNLETGQYDCKVCDEAGNLPTFLKRLWDLSSQATEDYQELAAERPPITIDTLIYWEAAKSILTGHWLLPGYGIDGEIKTLYKWSVPVGSATGKHRLQLAPETGHYPSGCGPTTWDPNEQKVYLVEGLWDGAVMWQVLRAEKLTGNVMSIPGGKTFKEAWSKLLAGKDVVLIPHSDHPREHPPGSGRFLKAGYDGMRRVVGLLGGSSTPPRSMRYVSWGEEGYDPSRKSGYDLRDLFQGGSVTSALSWLSSSERICPASWARPKSSSSGGSQLEPKQCDSWQVVCDAWAEALRMRVCLRDVLSVMLAVCLSTEQIGDQLFLQVIGEAGSAKTRFCDGLLVSKKCIPLEHITGFHSGWSDGTGKDFSFLSRANRKTWITPEMDVLMSSPQFHQIMSQQRRIFDGTSGATFKTKDEDMRWSGLRTPWIGAGTPALLETDQARLGDRFIRVCIDQPATDEKRLILKKVVQTALRNTVISSNGAADSQHDERMVNAYRLTGGYVNYLRENSDDLLSSVRVDHEYVEEVVPILAEYAADLRARPNPDKRKDLEAYKELPSRLASQFSRLALCLAVVTGSYRIDQEVIRVIAKVAKDTARGKTLAMAEFLYSCGQAGSPASGVQVAAKVGKDRCETLLEFMREIDLVECFSVKSPGGIRATVRWRLTKRLRMLYDDVMTF